MIDRIKSFFKWVYNWITVITGLVVGFLAMVPDLLTYLSGVDFSPIVGTEWGGRIVVIVAVCKAVVAFIRSKTAADGQGAAPL
jgi:preprotein translocase subunit SecY